VPGSMPEPRPEEEPMPQDTAIALAERFYDAIVRHDADGVRACLAPDFRIWTNVSDEMDVEDIIGMFPLMQQQVPDFHYEDFVRTPTAEGFVEEHSVVGTSPNGEPFNFRLCIIGVAQ